MGYAEDGRSQQPVAGPGDDVVRMLSKLTDDLERFDAIILRQRNMIEHGVRVLGAADDEQVRSGTAAIGAEAAHLAARARQALDELRNLGEGGGRPTLRARDRKAGRPESVASWRTP